MINSLDKNNSKDIFKGSDFKSQFIKQLMFFTPIFLIFYGTNSYGMHALKLYENPLGKLSSEQWVQESPIQYFIGFPINLIIDSTITTHWLVVTFGFVYLTISAYFVGKKYYQNVPILKVFYFTPFFLILFTWMGKPDTFTIGSLFFFIAFSNSQFLSLIFILGLIFSHPQVAFVYFILIRYLKIFKYKLSHLTSIFVGYVLYFIYLNQLEEFENRYSVISQELDRAFRTIFSNTLGGFVSLFMWLWIIIFISNLVKDKKFLLSFLLIFLISFFTLDHTRIFTILSVPLILYLINNSHFLSTFYELFDKKIMYLLGLFQIQKRADGKIVDGFNFYENETMNNLFSSIIKFVENLLNIS